MTESRVRIAMTSTDGRARIAPTCPDDDVRAELRRLLPELADHDERLHDRASDAYIQDEEIDAIRARIKRLESLIGDRDPETAPTLPSDEEGEECVRRFDIDVPKWAGEIRGRVQAASAAELAKLRAEVAAEKDVRRDAVKVAENAEARVKQLEAELAEAARLRTEMQRDLEARLATATARVRELEAQLAAKPAQRIRGCGS